MQADFAFQLRNAIGIKRHRRIVVAEGPVVFFTIDFDAADENEPFYPGVCGLLGEIERGGGVDPAEFRQRIGRAVIHDVHPGGEMDDDVNTVERGRPVRFAGYFDGEMPHHCRKAGGGGSRRRSNLPQPLALQSFDERPADKAGRAGDEASHDLFPA